MRRIREWLVRKWVGQPDPALLKSFLVTFSTEHGRRVLQHLVDKVYCSIYEGADPIALAMHNGRRSLVHEILENIDIAEHPGKYEVKQTEEEAQHARPGLV